MFRERWQDKRWMLTASMGVTWAFAVAACGSAKEGGDVIAVAPQTTTTEARPVAPPVYAEIDLNPEPAPTTSGDDEQAAEIEVEQDLVKPAPPPPPPPPPEPEPRQGMDECSGDGSLRVHVEGSDGEAITGQVSADFKRNGEKVNPAGEVIPNDQYSQTFWLDGQDGRRDVCFTGFPDAEVYLEIYPKDFVDGAFTYRSSKYGSAMWHGVWPGPSQAVSISVPRACAAGGEDGQTGTINVDATVNGEATPIRRLVAWSRAGASKRRTPGFSVADAAFYGTPEVKRLEQVASGQDYLVQVQTTNDRLMVLDSVHVETCKDTNVSVRISKSRCEVSIDGGNSKPCRLPSEPLG